MIRQHNYHVSCDFSAMFIPTFLEYIVLASFLWVEHWHLPSSELIYPSHIAGCIPLGQTFILFTLWASSACKRTVTTALMKYENDSMFVTGIFELSDPGCISIKCSLVQYPFMLGTILQKNSSHLWKIGIRCTSTIVLFTFS